MSIGHDERTARVRQLLVSGVSAPSRQRPWRLASLVAAVALASGVTGALSAAAIQQAAPYDDGMITTLALSAARANSIGIGQPHYVASSGTAAVSLGEPPSEATGLAVRTECTEPGTIDIELDGVWTSSVTCSNSGGGSGWVQPVSGSGDHSLTFEASGSGYKAWIVWVQEPPIPAISAQQAAETADGVATRDEYVAAFNRFVGCMGAAGYNIVGGDAEEIIFDYSIPGEAVSSGADEQCYVSQFKEVDMAWQIQNENSSDGAQLLRDCLADAGIEPADNMTDLNRQVADAGIDLPDCLG